MKRCLFFFTFWLVNFLITPPRSNHGSILRRYCHSVFFWWVPPPFPSSISKVQTGQNAHVQTGEKKTLGQCLKFKQDKKNHQSSAIARTDCNATPNQIVPFWKILPEKFYLFPVARQVFALLCLYGVVKVASQYASTDNKTNVKVKSVVNKGIRRQSGDRGN